MRQLKIMSVTPYSTYSVKGSRAALAAAHEKILDDIPNIALTTYLLPPPEKTSLGYKLLALFGYVDGLMYRELLKISDKINDESIDLIFIDGSNLGLLARHVKKHTKNTIVAIFFHNVEVRFFYGAFREAKSLKTLLVMTAHFIAERAAVRYSDVRILLNNRDSRVLKKVYGHSATHISPFTVPDIRSKPSSEIIGPTEEKYCIFVGGSFYANLQGIRWFAKHVASKVSIKTVVVGHGFEKYKSELEKHPNIEILGFVENISPWYRHAHFVIAPIFDGSGMKTKVAEALQYGKKIVGTEEAFVGYEDLLPEAGVLCTTDAEFVGAMSELAQASIPECDERLENIYECHFSNAAHSKRFKKIFAPFLESPIGDP